MTKGYSRNGNISEPLHVGGNVLDVKASNVMVNQNSDGGDLKGNIFADSLDMSHQMHNTFQDRRIQINRKINREKIASWQLSHKISRNQKK